MLTASLALERLRSGNRRFSKNLSKAVPSHQRRSSLTEGQAPDAIVLACADSRVPPELVFDVGLGDLFVVRVAGNVCAHSTLGSIEYAASVLGTELVVVMGHSRCGAVKATIDAVSNGKRPGSLGLEDIVERITPAVAPLVGRGLHQAELLNAAVRANVVLTAERLLRESRVLAERVRSGKLVIVSAEYALETGEVSFFDVSCALECALAAA
jgi:carbonic anhydrase